MKRITAIIVLLSIVCSCCACQPTPETPPVVSKNDGTLDRSVGRVSACKCMYYIFSTDGMTKRIPINDVLYIAGAGNYLEIHAKNPQAKFLERSTFTERMSRLPNFFVKVNRSVAVNMMNVDSFTSECVFFTDSDESIPVSKSFLPDIKKAFYKVNGL